MQHAWNAHVVNEWPLTNACSKPRYRTVNRQSPDVLLAVAIRMFAIRNAGLRLNPKSSPK